MPEVDEKDPRAMEGMKELQRRCMVYFSQPRTMGKQSVEDLRGIAFDFSVWFKNRYGLTFPKLVPMVIPSLGEVKFYRADWPEVEIEKNLLYMIKDYQKLGRRVDVTELAAATRWAWPHYRPPERDQLEAMKGLPQ